MNSTDAGCACAQPNVALAVGRFQTLELVDSHVEVFGTFGGSISNESLDRFASAGSDRLTEPQARYDGQTERFFAVVDDVTNDSLLVGVSATWNATTFWTWFPLTLGQPVESLAAPSVGLSSRDLAVAANVVNDTSGATVSSALWVLNKSSVIALVSPRSAQFGPSASFPPGVRAADSIGANASQYFAVENTTSSVLTTYRVVGVPPASTTLVSTNVSLAVRSAPVPATQPGGPSTLRAPPGGVGSAIWENGTLTAVGTASVSGVDAVELAQVNTTSGHVRQDLLLASGADLTYPAVTADSSGDLTIIADASNASLYPSIFVTGQPYNEPNATTGFSVLVPGGAAASANCNATMVCAWGNDSAAAPDPNDPAETWIAGEYSPGNGANWGTYIGVANFPPLALAYLSSDLPSVDVGQSVNFTAFATGGTGGYHYRWGPGLPTGCAGTTSATIACRPTVASNYNVTVTVQDAGGASAVSSVYPFTVSPQMSLSRPLANRTSADVGQNVSFRAGIAGGSPPYLPRWGVPVGATCSGLQSPELICTFLQPGVDAVNLSVSDQNYASVANGSSFTVFPDPELTTLAASPSTIEAGNPVNFVARAIFLGSGGVTYRWTGLPSGCTSTNAPNLTCTPASAGTFHVQLTLTDSNGVSNTTALLYNVTAPPVVAQPGVSLGLVVGVVVLGAAVVGVAVAVLVRRRRVAEGRA
ncbi:MAG TPA: PKD domain-containing protein [Thermoplasmata archaeon]|nr:PKD domain-containing protein [Thermoplasmata archaeon]